jgi:hypothetical protein
MEGMKRAAHRLLILAFAALLALPPGWCCFVNANSLRPAQGAEEAAPADCCCPAHKSKPDRPAPADDITPTRPPVVFCCCQPVPASVQKAEGQQAPDDGLAFPPAPAEPAPALRAAVPDGYDPAPPPKRPLHLLRCVWLC